MGGGCLAAAWKLMLFHRSLQKRWKPLGASCGPLPPRLRGTRGGCVVGVIHPWGNTDPVSICVKIQTHHHFETRGPQSVSHHHDSAGRGNPLPHPILSNFFGGFFGNKYIYVFFLSRADDFDFPCRAVGSRSTNEEVEHTHSAGGHGNQVKWATPVTVATIGRQKLRDGFGSSQLAFGTSWCFRRETNPWQLLIDGALKSRKVPVRLNSYQCNYLLFGFTQFFCVFFWLIFGQFWYRFWPRRTRWKTNLFFFWIFIFFFRAELAKVLVDGWILVA